MERHYFITGATGFIGRRLMAALLARKGTVVHLLTRESSLPKLDALRRQWGAERGAARARVVPVVGDIAAPRLGQSAEAVALLRGRFDAVFHLAAVYDLKADAAAQVKANVQGTRHAVQFAMGVKARHFHHVSSIAAAGLYDGVFREDMFDEAEHLEHPYFRTKHDAEKIVRRECRLPWTIYRPAMVVGDSATGEMDKIDGPYYLFKPIQRLRQNLPPWFPTLGIEGGRINIVPVDFVVRALDHIAHQPGIAGRCFHLVDPRGHRVGDVLAILAQAAHAPKFGLFVNAGLLGFVPGPVREGLLKIAPVRRLRAALMDDLGLPEEFLQFVNYPTRFDCSETLEMLDGSGIECPRLESYAWRLWDYWERHLDPELHIDRSLEGTVGGKVVLVTGGSSGIGLAAAIQFARAGAITLICARDTAKLEEAAREIRQQAGARARVYWYSVDVADEAGCAGFVKAVLAEHGGVDFLINNAGRSIRRAVEGSYERFHDYERTMQLNYFGCLRLTLGLLPGMVARGGGHVVNISSIGVLTNAPRFSAYVASKAALDAWTRCAASEFADRGVTFTTIHMPLVRTPMIAPTRLYDRVPMLSAAEAADLIAQACCFKPVRIATRLGRVGEILHALAPRLAQTIMNTTFRMFPDSDAARGEKPSRTRLSPEALALQQMMRGIHF